MPFNIGPFHISGSRGTWITEHQDSKAIKVLTGQPKDRRAPIYQAMPALEPRPRPSGLLPTLSITRTTDSTRFTNSLQLAAALKGRSEVVDSAEQVVQAVHKHIHNKVSQRNSTNDVRKLLVILGDRHDSNASMMMKLAATAEFRHQGATLLLEQDSASTDQHKQMARTVLANYAGSSTQAANEDARFHRAMTPGIKEQLWGMDQRGAIDMVFNVVVAAHCGVDVGHFDTVNSGVREDGGPRLYVEDREDSMFRDIRNALQHSAGPVIVQAGAFHVPALLARLRGEEGTRYDTLALSMLVDRTATPASSFARKRASALLANDEIVKLKAGPVIDGQAFRISPFASQIGINLSQPLPSAAIRELAPWDRHA